MELGTSKKERNSEVPAVTLLTRRLTRLRHVLPSASARFSRSNVSSHPMAKDRELQINELITIQ